MGATKKPKLLTGLELDAPFVTHTRPFTNLVLRDSAVSNAYLSGGPGADDVREVSNVRLERVRVARSYARNLALRSVVVDTCTTESPVRLVNCFLDGVVLRGEVGRWHMSLELITPKLRAYAKEFYDSVEWALDIREARFTDAIVRGVPVDKVRRDPDRHFLLRKGKLRADDSFRRLPTPLASRIAFQLSLGADDELLIVSDTSPDRERQRARYRALRDAGFAD